MHYFAPVTVILASTLEFMIAVRDCVNLCSDDLGVDLVKKMGTLGSTMHDDLVLFVLIRSLNWANDALVEYSSECFAFIPHYRTPPWIFACIYFR